MHGSLHSESALGIAVTTDDQDELNSARKCVEDGDFTRARSILEPALQDARGAFDAQAKRLVELMLLYESAVAETSNVADARNLAALEVCHEAAQVSAVAHVGMEASVATINSASARHVTEGSWKTYVELLRHLIKTVGYAKRTDFDVGWLQEQVVLVLLSAQDVAGALAEAESWTFWPLDDIGLWLLVEAYFQSQRPECVPILERMLRNKAERDEPSVKRMEDMIEEAKAWNADRRG